MVLAIPHLYSTFENHHKILCSVSSVPQHCCACPGKPCSLLLILSGDVEINPEVLQRIFLNVPLESQQHICHDYSKLFLSAHDYSKLFLLKAYIMLPKFDIIYLSETYLDSISPTDDDKLQTPGYTWIHSDYPSNIHSGGVCKYSRGSLPLRVINIGY